MTDTLEDTLVVPAPAAVAGVVNTITIHVPPAAPAKASVPAVARSKKPATAVSPKKETGWPFGDEFVPVPVAVKEKNSRDANGHAITQLEDSKGASIELRAGHNGAMHATFKDANRVTTTQTTKNGFKGSTTYQVPEYGVPKPLVQAEAAYGTGQGLGAWLGRTFNGDVVCGEETASVSNDVIDATARERIQAFAKAHPELATALRASKEKVTVIGGVPTTMEQVENSPASHRACPENTRGTGAVKAL